MWKCGGIIGTLNYSFTIRTIRIVWTKYHYSVFIFGPFSKPEYIWYSVFGVFSDPKYIRYSVKNKYSAQDCVHTLDCHCQEGVPSQGGLRREIHHVQVEHYEGLFK